VNKLAAINQAVEEVNKQAFLGTALRGIAALSNRAGQSIVRGASTGTGAASAAASASKPSLMNKIPGYKFSNSIPGTAAAVGVGMLPAPGTNLR
jgi:hypothetical protein